MLAIRANSRWGNALGHLVFVECTRTSIQALELARAAGHRVSLITDHRFDKLLFGPRELLRLRAFAADTIEVADTQRADEVELGLRTAMQRAPVDSVLSTLHLCVVATAEAAERLGLRATSHAGVMNAHDKARCREALAAHGVASVRFAVVESAARARSEAQRIGFPLIAKPTTGSGKVLARIVANLDELEAHLADAEQQIQALRSCREEVTFRFNLEEIAVGPMFSVEVATSAQGEWAALVFLRRKRARHNPVLEMGSTIPCGFSEAQFGEAERYMRQVTDALGLDFGMFHAEFVWTAQGPRLIEVNPRIAGGSIPDLVRAATGANLFETLVRVHAGERLGLGRLTCRGASSHTYIAAREDSRVRSDLAPDWFDAFRPRLLEGYSDIAAGQLLRRMDGNSDTYGVMRVQAATPTAAAEQAEALRRDAQAALGVALVEVEEA